MRKIIFTGLLLVALTGCQGDDGSEMLNNNPVAFTSIVKNNLYGNGAEGIEEANRVINDNQAWQELLGQITLVNSLTPDFGDTNVDFSQYTVIAVFDEIRMSGGFSIDVVSVINQNDTSLIVDVEESDGGSGAEATVITQPFHIVKIPKTTLPITFE